MGDVFPIGDSRHSSKYDENAYYVSTTDSKGHSAKCEVRYAPDVLSEIQEIVADRNNPFRTSQDYIRNATVHQLNRDATQSNDPTFVSHVAEITARYRFETELAIEENRRAMVAAAEKVARLAESAPPAEKDRLLAQLRLQTIAMSQQARTQIEAIVKRSEH